MNENVTNKTPKRRRWIARLLVSALCILLASSLLFVTVVAENVNSFTLESIDNSTSDVKTFYGLACFEDGWYGSFVFDVLPSLKCTASVYRDVAGDPENITYNINLTYPSNDIGLVQYFCGYYAIYYSYVTSDTTYSYLELYEFGNSNSDHCFLIGEGRFVVPTSSVTDGAIYDGTNYVYFLHFDDAGSTTWVGSLNGSLYAYGVSYLLFDNGWYSVSGGVNDENSDTNFLDLTTFVLHEDSGTGGSIASGSLCYSGYDCYSLTRLAFGNPYLRKKELSNFVVSNALVVQDATFKSLLTSTVQQYYMFVFVEGALLSPNFNGDFVGYKFFKNYNLNIFRVYATSSEYVPPESSDETTESPPPESSDDSSEDPAGGGTKIWKVDRGFVESYAGTIDLTNATEIRAFLGVFTSSGSGFSSDSAVPLTLEVYRDGSDTPDSYTFDFYAYGWGVLGLDGFPNSYDSYTFPDVVGLYYEIPIPSDGEGLLFPTFAPYGSIYVNFSDSAYPDNIQRVTFNLHNSQGYLDVNFASASSTSFTIYNDDLTKGKTYSFNSGTFNYKCFFDLDGEYSETEWYSPQFGSSIKYYAEDVLESGLYAIYSFNEDSIEYPWGNGEWSNTILGNNSRLEDISTDYAILESKANALYGNYTFDPLFGADFNDAVSRFNVVKDSSGGQTLLGFFNGMWSVHPFASSMIAIVGTLAIVGFIIRKL